MREAKKKMREKNNQKQKSGAKEMPIMNIPLREDMDKGLRKCIIGQDDFIKKITVAIYRALMYGFKSNILIVGGSGSGKTETIKILAEILNLPYTIESATEYTQSGYVGSDIEDIVDNLYANAVRHKNVDILAAGLGIVVMDEIDKKAEAESMLRGDSVSGRAVQQRLLKFMEGMYIPVYNDYTPIFTLNTEGLIFIAMGAFEGLDEIRKKRQKANSMGFVDTSNVVIDDIDKDYTEADFIKYGMIKEFIGRFDCIATTKKLSESDLVKIITTSQISEFKVYENLLSLQGIKLEYSEKMIQNLAKKAFSMNTGARAIKNVSNYIFQNIICELMDNYTNEYTICKLSDDIVRDNTKYILK